MTTKAIYLVAAIVPFGLVALAIVMLVQRYMQRRAVA